MEVNSEVISGNYLDVGYVIVEGKKMDFLDYAAEDRISLVGKNVTIVGYVSAFNEWNPNKVWGYRFDTYVSAGEPNQSRAKFMTKPLLTVLVRAIQPDDLGKNLSAMRKSNYKMLVKSTHGKALVRFSGKANVFSNTGDLYIETNMMEVLDYK